tara:strand:+ start:453 stop:2681 length:2229 start_codon:yes stop_codon:yes gene_type:complete
MSFISNSITKKRLRTDKWARLVIAGFGGLVLLTLVILITHLISQALPLAYIPSLKHLTTLSAPRGEPIISAGDVINGQPLLVKAQDCRISLQLLQNDNNKEGALQSHHEYIRPCEHELTSHSVMGENYIVDVSPKGQVRVLPVRTVPLSGINKQIGDGVELNDTLGNGASSFSLPIDQWAKREKWSFALSTQWVVVAIERNEHVFVRWVNRERPTQVIDKVLHNVDRLTLLPGSENMLFQRGNALFLKRLRDADETTIPIVGNVSQEPSAIAIFPLEKHRAFFLFNQSDGLLTRWVLSRGTQGLTFEQTYQVEFAENEYVVDVAEHASMNVLSILVGKHVTGPEQGQSQKMLLVNRVSGDVVKTESLKSSAAELTWFGDKLYGTSRDTLSIWQGEHLSGITTWSSLFEPQHYEGYETRETVWQTTSASDYQEAKFSLTPLIIGSVKASLLALLIAIPVAIGAAVYTAYFAKNKLRNVIKPAIELLEAIPSVLIGFIAAIWLSPKAEQFLFSFAFFLIVIPFILIAVSIVQRPIAEKLPKRFRHGAELLFAIGGAFILGYVSVVFAPSIVFSILGVDGFTLLASESNSPIGKTTIVVALALGVAISPSIYSLAEDAINGVPNDLKHASFALGATRLQTLMHVVLHVALPGIVAAIMLGFGRAFGETMIVLMVTGNTPISSWGLIEGLRALTANLAIELPEADASSAHYQILFFTACILFLFTFLVNTVAELVRQKIRSKTFNG